MAYRSTAPPRRRPSTPRCGGLGGVMEAAARGAKQRGGLTVGILPGSAADEANPYIDVPLATGMGEMRNALIVRAAQAAIAIGGGWGTLSEIAMAQRIKTPVVGLHDAFTSAIDIPRVATPQAAVAWALEQAARPEAELGMNAGTKFAIGA